MFLKKAEKTPAAQRGVSWYAKLQAVPRHNAAAEVQLEEDGTLRITVQLLKPKWLVPPLNYIIKISPSRTWHLDAIGSAVWQLCDGRSLEEVIDAFAKAHRLTFHEARVAVMAYLARLMQRGLVGMVQAQA